MPSWSCLELADIKHYDMQNGQLHKFYAVAFFLRVTEQLTKPDWALTLEFPV